MEFNKFIEALLSRRMTIEENKALSTIIDSFEASIKSKYISLVVAEKEKYDELLYKKIMGRKEKTQANKKFNI